MINDDQPQYDPNLDAIQNAPLTDEEVEKRAVNPAKRFVANLGVAAGIGAGVLGGMVGTASAEEGPSPQPSVSAEASESASPESDPSETPSDESSEEPTTDPTPDTYPGDTGEEEEEGEVITVPGGSEVNPSPTTTPKVVTNEPDRTAVLPPPKAEVATNGGSSTLPNTGAPTDVLLATGLGLTLVGAAAQKKGMQRPKDS